MAARPSSIAVAAVAFPHLPLELARLPAGSGAAAPCAVVVDPEEGDFLIRSVTPLVDATLEARAAGVRPGMRVLDAQRHEPMLQVHAVKRRQLDAALRLLAGVDLRLRGFAETGHAPEQVELPGRGESALVERKIRVGSTGQWGLADATGTRPARIRAVAYLRIEL